jgi:hypothetical protein
LTFDRLLEMRQPSTRSLADLPSISDLMRQSQALAMLDAILSPEWEYRYYSYNSRWAPGATMASMRNGSGDEYFILFDGVGAAIKGFDHEADMSPWQADPPTVWPGVLDSVPVEFAAFLEEPAFAISDVTFCIWRQHGDAAWQCGVRDYPAGDDPDGSAWMLAIFDGDAATYQAFAQQYYEVDVPLAAIEHIYDLKPLSNEIVNALNADVTLEALEPDTLEIGYL